MLAATIEGVSLLVIGLWATFLDPKNCSPSSQGEIQQPPTGLPLLEAG